MTELSRIRETWTMPLKVDRQVDRCSVRDGEHNGIKGFFDHWRCCYDAAPDSSLAFPLALISSRSHRENKAHTDRATAS